MNSLEQSERKITAKNYILHIFKLTKTFCTTSRFTHAMFHLSTQAKHITHSCIEESHLKTPVLSDAMTGELCIH